MVNWGLGRRKAVISWACISSTLSASAFRVGLLASKRALTWSHDRLCCATAQSGTSSATTAPAYREEILFIDDPMPSGQTANQGEWTCDVWKGPGDSERGRSTIA